MANLVITKLLTELDAIDGAEAFLEHARRRGLYQSTPRNVIKGWLTRMITKEFQGVSVVKIARNSDPEDDTYGLVEVTLDPACPTTKLIRRFIENGVGGGWRMTEEGTIKAIPAQPVHRMEALHSDRFTQEVFLGVQFWNRGPHTYYSSTTMTPRVELTLDWQHDRNVDIGQVGGLPFPAMGFPVALWSAPSARVLTIHPGVGERTFMSWMHDGKGGDDFWTWAETSHRISGFQIRVDACGTVTSGSEALFQTHLGIPKNPEIVKALIAKREDPRVTRRGRVLEVDDSLTKDSVAVFPYHLRGARTEDWAIVQGTNGRGRRTREPEHRIGICPIVFHVSPDRKYLHDNRGFALSRLEQAWPKALNGNERALWRLPTDRLLVFRSPIGWHGIFILNGIIRPGPDQYLGTPEVPVCYMIPTFMNFSDLKDKFVTFRRMSAPTREAIQQSYGLAHFLEQALHALHGGLHKLAREGNTIDDIPHRATEKARLTLPAGHLIRTWGAGNRGFDYDPMDESGNFPRKHRASRVAHRAMFSMSGVGHVAFAENDNGVLDLQEPLQRVATLRRVLDV